MSQKYTNFFETGYFTDASTCFFDSSNPSANPSIVLNNTNGQTGLRNNFVAAYDFDGSLDWVVQMGGNNNGGNQDQGRRVFTDFNNNVYNSGYFNDLSFNIYNPITSPNTSGSLPSVALTLSNLYPTSNSPSNNNITCYLSKFNPSGNLQWAAQMGGTTPNINTNNSAIGIFTDTSNDVYLTGAFSDLSFNLYNAITPGQVLNPSSPPITLYSTFGSSSQVFFINGFVTKYNGSNGQVQWAAKLGRNPVGAVNSSTGDTGFQNCIDSNNNMLLVGTFSDVSFCFYSPVTPTTNNDSASTPLLTLANINPTASVTNTSFNGYVAKYNTNGTVLWAAQMGATSVAARGVYTDSNNNVYTSGSYQSDTSFNLYDSIQATNTTTGINLPPAIKLLNPDPSGNANGYITKYNSNGKVQWAAKLAGVDTYTQSTLYESVFSVNIDQNNQLYASGSFVDGSFNIYNGVATGSTDNNTVGIVLSNTYPVVDKGKTRNAFIAKYDANGIPLWAAQMGGYGANNQFAVAFALAADNDGGLYVFGNFADLTFTLYDAISNTTSGKSTTSFTLQNPAGQNGVANSFVAKYNSSNGSLIWAFSLGSSTKQLSVPGSTTLLMSLNYGCVSRYVAIPKPTPPKPEPISNICFPGNTPIATDQGMIPIKKIDIKVHTINGRPIVAITKTKSDSDYLVCFEKDCLGQYYPYHNTTMSKDHTVFCGGKMIRAEAFLGKVEGVKKVKYQGQVLYNILLEEAYAVKVNNLICETLHPDNLIAKLYTSNMSEQYKESLVVVMNESIKKGDSKKYKKVTQFI